MSDEENTEEESPENPSEFKMGWANIPDLPLEDYEPVEEEEKEEVKDTSGGALAYAFIGAGQGGGRMVKAFYDLGYKKTLAINTAKNDLNLLELPDAHKFYIDHFGDQGAGKRSSQSCRGFSE